MSVTRAYEAMLRETGHGMLRETGDYFAGGGRLNETLRRLATRLDDQGIPYVLVGGMALGRYHYVRMTDDVDVLLTCEGFERFHERWVGWGYVVTYPAARRSVREVESGVRIEFRVTGE